VQAGSPGTGTDINSHPGSGAGVEAVEEGWIDVSFPGARADCSLCGNREARFAGGDPTPITCPICGNFEITLEVSVDREFQGQTHPYLSAATRKANESGRVLRLEMDNWQDFETEQRSISVSQKLLDSWIKDRKQEYFNIAVVKPRVTSRLLR
jgi:hypothetical protein